MKKMKCYRINEFVLKELEKILKEINITETSFIEMAIIEKMARINFYEDKDKNNN